MCFVWFVIHSLLASLDSTSGGLNRRRGYQSITQQYLKKMFNKG